MKLEVSKNEKKTKSIGFTKVFAIKGESQKSTLKRYEKDKRQGGYLIEV